MGISDQTARAATFSLPGQKLKKLNLEQIKQIDDALDSIGEYCEVRLILQHGELRYINKVESQKAWKSYGHPD